MKGIAVKTIRMCVLLSLVSVVAYAGFSGALSGAGQPGSGTFLRVCVLHQTRDDNMHRRVAARVNVCPE